MNERKYLIRQAILMALYKKKIPQTFESLIDGPHLKLCFNKIMLDNEDIIIVRGEVVELENNSYIKKPLGFELYYSLHPDIRSNLDSASSNLFSTERPLKNDFFIWGIEAFSEE